MYMIQSREAAYRVLFYIADTGHPPPSSKLEVAQMERGELFPFHVPDKDGALRILRELPKDHPFYPEAK